jgi:hypothetical protein
MFRLHLTYAHHSTRQQRYVIIRIISMLNLNAFDRMRVSINHISGLIVDIPFHLELIPLHPVQDPQINGQHINELLCSFFSFLWPGFIFFFGGTMHLHVAGDATCSTKTVRHVFTAKRIACCVLMADDGNLGLRGVDEYVAVSLTDAAVAFFDVHLGQGLAFYREGYGAAVAASRVEFYAFAFDFGELAGEFGGDVVWFVFTFSIETLEY